ncbi:mitochondrial import receptor subunit TOM40 homolog 1-like [Tachypleus tridentatus]|uniref:mitochondrial import receptor subunit TOM40 homolog 1-like n=1 Tax=Tachypleus tridentatus TaxID=6853 RepID=UPI003FD4818D
MGNVLASSFSPSPVTPPAPPTGAPPPTAGDSFIPDETAKINDLNPGSLEDLHKKCKDIFPVNFEGAKLMVNKGLSNHFQISHTLSMSSVTPSGYRFGATYVGTKQLSPTEAYPVLLGDIDPSGNLNANIIHQFNKCIRTKFAAQIQDSRYVASQLTTDFKGHDYTAALTFGNNDILNGSGVAVLHYLQSVTAKVVAGAELAYQYGSQVSGGEIAVLSLAGRYSGQNCILTGSVSTAGAHMCYYHKGNDQVQVGVEVETNFRLGESVGTIGYQIDLPKANLVFKGSVDSNWTIGAVLEKKLQPLPFTLALSGMLNHAKNQSRFGCGLIIG